MACVASKHIFGGGMYSTSHNRLLKMVGARERRLAEIEISRKGRRGIRDQRGVYRAAIVDPYLPKHITEPYHPGGNSVCYMIQTAHLMGCDPIILLGFTLESGTGYHFGMDNPVTRRRSFYETEQPMHWLRWYEERYPGRVRLFPGWRGPIYEVFDEERYEAESGARHEPDAGSGDDEGEQ